MKREKLRIEGEKVNLRTLDLADAGSLLENANDLEVAKYTRLPHPYTIDHARSYIDDVLNGSKGESLKLGIVLKENDNVVGTISLKEFDLENKNSELGYWLGREYWRKGYMQEAIKLILDYGFNNFDLERIYAKVLHPNTASAKLLEKIGFVLEGKTRKSSLRRGEWMDEFIYGVIKEDYNKS